MTIVKKNILIILFYLVVNCLIILSVNYSIANESYDLPYGLSIDHLVFDAKNNIQEKIGFEFLNTNKNIIAIAETKNKSLIGLYDPTMKYYIDSTKFIDPKKFRYFSSEDYNNKYNAGIVVYSLDKITQDGLDKINISKIENDYNINVINIFDPTSLIAENNSYIVANLFSIDPSEITTIYIDSSNINDIKNLKKKMKKYGYKDMSIDNSKSIINTLNNSKHGGKYVRFIMYSSFFAYFLLLYALTIFIYKYDKYVYINRMFGATFIKMLKLFFMNIFLTSIIASLFSSFLMTVYLEIINKNYMTLLNYFQVEIFLIASFMITILVKYFTLFKKSKRVMR